MFVRFIVLAQVQIASLLQGDRAWGVRELIAEPLAGSFTLAGQSLRFLTPEWVLLGALIFFLPWFARRSLSDLGRARSWALLAAQSAFVLCICLGLMQPTIQRGAQEKSRVILFDVSDSISDDGLNKARLLLKEHQRSGEAQRVILFAANARLVDALTLEKGSWRTHVDTTATRLSGALQLADAHCPIKTDCHLYLHSDGLENRGSVLAEVAKIKAAGRTVHALAYGVSSTADVAIKGFRSTQNIRAGESFYLEVELNSLGSNRGKLEVRRREPKSRVLFTEQLDLEPGERTIRIKTQAIGASEHQYVATFQSESVERFVENNRASLSVRVPEAPRVLLIDPQPRSLAPLVSLLSAQRFIVEPRAPAGFPRSDSELGAFDFIILSDVPRSSLGRREEERLIDYVQKGGALLVAGGAAAYGGGGWQGSPLFKVLPVSIRSSSRRDLPGIAMSLVIDRSGSMSGLPLAMAKEACKATLELLKPTDLIEVIAFDSTPLRAVRMAPSRAKARMGSAIMRVRPGGGTSFFRPLQLAFDDLSSVRARRKHIILLTDGNGGTEGLIDLAQLAFAEGISLTTVGLGDEVNLALLEGLADAGGGRFHHVVDAHHLPRIFSRETELITKNESPEDWLDVHVNSRPDFLKGLDLRSLPLLHGVSQSVARSVPSQLILVTESGVPVLSRRPVGQGWSLAWGSDLKSNQAQQWLRWNKMGVLLAQLIRGHQKEKQETLFPLELKKLGESLTVRFERVTSQGEYQSELKSSLQLIQVENQATQIESFRLVAPGLYEARVKLSGLGMYQIAATHRLKEEGVSREVGRSFLSFSHSLPDELLRLTPDRQLLNTIGKGSAGQQGQLSLAARSSGAKVHLLELNLSSYALWGSILTLILSVGIRRVSFNFGDKKVKELN